MVARARNAAFGNTGWYSSGSRLATISPTNAPTAERSTVSSNVTGIATGNPKNGLPLIRYR